MPQQFEPKTEQDMPVTPVLPSALPSVYVVAEQISVAEPLDTVRCQEWTPTLQQWHQTNKKNISLQVGIEVMFLLFFVSLIFCLTSIVAPNISFIAFFGTTLIFTAGLLALGWKAKRTARETKAVALEQIEDLRAIGPLLEIFHDAATKLEQNLTASALARLLPHLHSGDTEPLTPAQKTILYDCVTMRTARDYPELFTACMSAIEQIGDKYALPPLARLIARDAPTQNEQQARERARACVDCLLARLDFGTVQSIPDWIALLPFSATPGSVAPSMRRGTDDALIALFALTRLLPQLQPSDAPLFKHGIGGQLGQGWLWMRMALTNTVARTDMLLARLGSDYSFAVLEALQQVGTGADYPIPDWIFRDVPIDDLPFLRMRAREVSIVLEARLAKEQVGSMLLRGASAPEAASGELLRAATDAGRARSEPQELLRADAKPLSE